MPDDTAGRPSVRRVVRGLLADYGTVTHPLLVAMTHAEAAAAPWIIRATIKRLESDGEIYNATGDDTRPRWRLTHP
jgi:hypothetical protein